MASSQPRREVECAVRTLSMKLISHHVRECTHRCAWADHDTWVDRISMSAGSIRASLGLSRICVACTAE